MMKNKILAILTAIIVFCSITIINPTHNHFAYAGTSGGGGGYGGDTLDWGKPGTGGGSGGTSSGGGSGKGSTGSTGGGSTVILTPQRSVRYIDTVNWGPIEDYWNRQTALIEAGKNTSGYIAPYVIQSEKYTRKCSTLCLEYELACS